MIGSNDEKLIAGAIDGVAPKVTQREPSTNHRQYRPAASMYGPPESEFSSLPPGMLTAPSVCSGCPSHVCR
jgi:hypothetical protein